jgi:hypothetical protein
MVQVVPVGQILAIAQPAREAADHPLGRSAAFPNPAMLRSKQRFTQPEPP